MGRTGSRGADRRRSKLLLWRKPERIGEGIEQMEARFFVERHERGANDGLGHRVDAKNGRGIERLLAGVITDAAVVKVDDFAAAGEERGDAREIA